MKVKISMLKTLFFILLSLAPVRVVHADDTSSTTPTEWNATSRSAGNRPGAPGGPSSLGESFREGPMGGIWQRTNLLGNMGGLRSVLGRLGISLNIQQTSEELGNVTGGVHKGFNYDGLTTMTLQMDTKRAFGLYGGLFNASALQIHGVNLSSRNLYTQQTSSGIEADNSLRLWELWYQQTFDFNQWDVKIGAQSLDQEFIVSQYAGLFLNTMFGWPMLPSADLLGGGPAYPLASLGARLRFQPSAEPWAFLAGVYNDNPSGLNPQSSPAQDPQQLDHSGTNFRLKDKPLVFGEVQFSKPAVGQVEYADHEPILPATYKLGFWYDFGKFADQRYSTNGFSLANPGSSGVPGLVQNNWSIYGVIDQLFWRESPESAEGIGFFARVMGGPSKQNLIDYSINAGLNWHAPFRHREYDALGLALGRAHTSSAATGLDQDTGGFVRSSETFLEATYQYQVVPWWNLQPDVQYIFNPGSGIANPLNPSQEVANELVMGVRTNITL